MKQVFTYNLPLKLEYGGELPKVEITFHTYGEMNPTRDNVVWVFHALTANSDAAEWWNGLIGEGKQFDPSKYFIVCANILGSCYGTTGPLSIDPSTRTPYYHRFPIITIRDMVKAHRLLAKYLGVNKILFGLGGSMGGYQLLEWAAEESERFENIVLLATSAAESAWGIAIHTTQRMAIEADPDWKENHPQAGKKGLMTARGVGMLTYRNYETYVRTQRDEDGRIDGHSAESYIRYQGEKLARRFNAMSYYTLTKAMDSHHLGRKRGSVESVLAQIQSNVLIIGISSDLLCPPAEQEFLARHIPHATYQLIDSSYGHDGFLIEFRAISDAISAHFRS
ncbi:MAG: homoserine O-acetyltransferase [Flavobacteriales bacterium]